MKKLLFGIIIVVLLITFVGCQPQATVYEAIIEIGTEVENSDNSYRYDLDERFNYFQSFRLEGLCELHLNATTGIVTYSFTASENEDGSITCTLRGIYVYDVSTIGYGSISEDDLSDFVDRLTFTLVLENNVVTSHDLPQLIVE